MATAGNGAKPQAASAAATDSSADASQGFAASAADNKIDPNKIPDPASYEETDQKAATGNAPDTTKAAAAIVANRAPTADAVSPHMSSPAGVTVSAAQVNPIVVAGIPLAAAVLLMGVYWLILRAGTV